MRGVDVGRVGSQYRREERLCIVVVEVVAMRVEVVRRGVAKQSREW